MKYEMTPCTQCGAEFKRTNARHLYCSGACRVSAHRDRHGYEQPIFTYPSIRAVEQIRALDLEALYRIKIYAMWYLKELKEKGEPIPPTETKMEGIRLTTYLHMELEDGSMDELNKIVEPLSELLQFVSKIKEDAAKN
jgi:hypothetical protein